MPHPGGRQEDDRHFRHRDGADLQCHLIRAEAQALKNGQDLRHTLISNLEDPDNPNNQRISVTGVSFDDLTLADWEAARLGQIEAPFTFEDFDVLDS